MSRRVQAVKDFLKYASNLIRRLVTSSDKNVPQSTKTEITDSLRDSVQIVQRDAERIEEQLKILRRIDRQLTEAGEPRRAAQIRQITKDSTIDEILQDLAERAGTSPDKARTALVNRANEAYPPGDPKRMRFDDDETLEAYARVKIQMGEGDELLRDVTDAGAKEETMRKLSMSPDEFDKMIGPGRPRSIYDEIAEDEMLPFGRSGEADDFGRPPSVQKRMDEMLEEGQKKVDKVEEYKKIFEGKMPKRNLGLTDEEIKFLRGDLDDTEDLVEAQKAINQQKRDQKAVEDLMADPKNFGKSIDELMQMVQDAKIIPFKPKKALGGRVGARKGLFTGIGKKAAEMMGDEGLLGILFNRIAGMRRADRMADQEQVKNIIRDPKTDLERVPTTPENKPTIREMESLPEELGYKNPELRKFEDFIEREKVRAILADQMTTKVGRQVDPSEITEDMIDAAIREGMSLFSRGGVAGLFKQRTK